MPGRTHRPARKSPGCVLSALRARPWPRWRALGHSFKRAAALTWAHKPAPPLQLWADERQQMLRVVGPAARCARLSRLAVATGCRCQPAAACSACQRSGVQRHTGNRAAYQGRGVRNGSGTRTARAAGADAGSCSGHKTKSCSGDRGRLCASRRPKGAAPSLPHPSLTCAASWPRTNAAALHGKTEALHKQPPS